MTTITPVTYSPVKGYTAAAVEQYYVYRLSGLGLGKGAGMRVEGVKEVAGLVGIFLT